MTALPAFSNILTSLSRVWSARKSDECVLSLALPIRGIDPLSCLPILSKSQKFRFLWELSATDSFVASGNSQHIDLTGPKRFELAQRFSDSIFARLLDVTPEVPINARPRVLFACSFFEQISERYLDNENPPLLQALLPRWQLVRTGEVSYLRINGLAINESDTRELAEQLWIMWETISANKKQGLSRQLPNLCEFQGVQNWQSCYQPVLNKGIDLVNSGAIKKLVLAVRQSILLDNPLDPLSVLLRLRDQQKGSCRFLWQSNFDQSFFGASPERLFKLKGSSLFSDALAGTSTVDLPGNILLGSEKDRREHQVVVSSILDQLIAQGLNPKCSSKPNLVRHGKLFHLHTQIFSKVNFIKPFQLVGALHPTPAVAGFPVKEAINWIRALEPFERGRYAAPIGWIDSLGNSEFRVAIRCGNTSGKKLDLMAGAGLVRGSIKEKELREVALKFEVLSDQFDLTKTF